MQNDRLRDIKFICPRCKDDLINKRDYLVCGKCLSQYLIKEGIPFFSKTKYYFDDVSKRDMEEYINIADKKGWRIVLYNHLRPRNFYIYRYASDESRADWRYFLPLSEKSVVLDWGCGWGIISVVLSRVCNKVISIDSTYEKIRFLEVKRKQERIDNIYPVYGGDQGEIPFPNSYFDTIILNGVLEWAGCVQEEKDSLVAQKKMLRSCFNYLKDNGCLYIGIENRFGYNYILGARDHNNLRFTSLMPRKVANFYSYLLKEEGYKTLTHSYAAYKRLIEEVGFSEIEFFLPIPSYQNPLFIIPLDNNNVFGYFLRHLFSMRSKKFKGQIIYYVSQILLSLNLMKYLVPAYSIIARKKKVL